MKKIICLVLIFVIMAAACSNQSAGTASEQPDESTAEPSSAEITVENGEKILAYLGSEKCIDWNTGISKLSAIGISYEVKNVSFVDDWYWSAELVLKKGESELVIPIDGLYDYTEEYDVIRAPYGAFEIYDGYIVYAGKGKTVFFDKENLEVWDFKPELNKDGFDDIWVNAATFEEASGNYILLTTALNKKDTEERSTFVNIYDKEGKLLSKKETQLSKLSPAGDCDYMFPYCDGSPCELFYSGGDSFIKTKSFLINIKTGETLEFYEAGDFTDGDYSIKLYGYKRKKNEERGYAAFLYKNGVQKNSFFFEEYNLSIYNSEIDKPTVKISSDGKKAIYYSDYFAMTLEIDFENKTHSVKYEPEDRHISEVGATSADGKYSICLFGENGGGDAWYNHIAVKNNETGKYHYMGETGGMYGGNGGYGFLKNDDAYNYSLYTLQIFDSETGELKFDIAKNFPLGYGSDGKRGRGIFTFRRDPDDFSYIIVYFEFDGGCSWKEVFDDDKMYVCDGASYNYKIGFLDSEGKLLESYDTGFSVLASPFGFYSVQMRYSEEKLLLFFDNFGKGEGHFEGEFDMAAKKFTISENILNKTEG